MDRQLVELGHLARMLKAGKVNWVGTLDGMIVSGTVQVVITMVMILMKENTIEKQPTIHR